MQELLTSALLTDLYEITMGGGYFHNNIQEEASFELFVRNLPPKRSYLLVAGLEQVADFLENLHFEDEEIKYLKSLPALKGVDPEFFDYLRELRFEGTLRAVPEGRVVFAEEPILQVTAPMIQAQLVETCLLTQIAFQTAVATKASRVVLAARRDGVSRDVVDFGSRRAHGPEAGVLAARASYIGGCSGTSNVYAGMKFGIQPVGTAAHSWTMAFLTEEEAFDAYHRTYPDASVLLIDTYDTLEGAKNATKYGKDLKGVRLDSGDLISLSKEVRKILDQAGCEQAKIIASGNLNEYKIEEMVRQKAPVDLFGVGTEMVTSRDAPSLGAVYKLVERKRAGEPLYVAKFSEEKATLPGCKQIVRFMDRDGFIARDMLIKDDEEIPEGGIPLLATVLENGKRTVELPALNDIQARARQSLDSLPDSYKTLDAEEKMTIEPSEKLHQLMKHVYRRLEKEENR